MITIFLFHRRVPDESLRARFLEWRSKLVRWRWYCFLLLSLWTSVTHLIRTREALRQSLLVLVCECHGAWWCCRCRHQFRGKSHVHCKGIAVAIMNIAFETEYFQFLGVLLCFFKLFTKHYFSNSFLPFFFFFIIRLSFTFCFLSLPLWYAIFSYALPWLT